MTWRPCWWCGLPLLDDETALCAGHGDLAAPRVIDPARPDILKGLSDGAMADLAANFTAVHVEQLQHQADAWAAVHDLVPVDRRAYVAAAVRAAGEWLAGIPQREAEDIIRERRLRRDLEWRDAVAAARAA